MQDDISYRKSINDAKNYHGDSILLMMRELYQANKANLAETISIAATSNLYGDVRIDFDFKSGSVEATSMSASVTEHLSFKALVEPIELCISAIAKEEFTKRVGEHMPASGMMFFQTLAKPRMSGGQLNDIKCLNDVEERLGGISILRKN